MIIEHKESTLKLDKEFQSMEFSIKEQDMGLILEILRKKMYKDPISSICREVACNARDANREAGRGDVPVEITLAKKAIFQKPYSISFKDFGPGISPERMADVFVNYGSTTKANTNEQTGGFGLGAKTPFAYSDAFLIKTIVNNVLYIYSAVIEQGKKGKILLIGKEETEHINGTEIIVPIDESDVDKFHSGVLVATSFWDVPPKYTRLEQHTQKVETFKFYDFLVLKKAGNLPFESGFQLIVDGIYYPVDRYKLDFPYTYSDWVFPLIFKNGELDIAANREAIQYSPETIAKIKEKFKVTAQKVIGSIMQDIDACPDKISANIWIKNNPLGYDIGKAFGLELKWRKEKLEFNWHNKLEIKYVIIDPGNGTYSCKKQKDELRSPLLFFGTYPTQTRNLTLVKEEITKFSLIDDTKLEPAQIIALRDYGFKIRKYNDLEKTPVPREAKASSVTQSEYTIVHAYNQSSYAYPLKKDKFGTIYEKTDHGLSRLSKSTAYICLDSLQKVVENTHTYEKDLASVAKWMNYTPIYVGRRSEASLIAYGLKSVQQLIEQYDFTPYKEDVKNSFLSNISVGFLKTINLPDRYKQEITKVLKASENRKRLPEFIKQKFADDPEIKKEVEATQSVINEIPQIFPLLKHLEYAKKDDINEYISMVWEKTNSKKSEEKVNVNAKEAVNSFLQRS